MSHPFPLVAAQDQQETVDRVVWLVCEVEALLQDPAALNHHTQSHSGLPAARLLLAEGREVEKVHQVRLPEEVREVAETHVSPLRAMQRHTVVLARIARCEVKDLARYFDDEIRVVHAILVEELSRAHSVGLHAEAAHPHAQRPVEIVAVTTAAHATARAVDESECPADVGGEARVEGKAQGLIVVVTPQDAVVNWYAVQVRLPQAKGWVERVLDLLHTEGLVAEAALELFKPKGVIRRYEMV